jgi:hypothetical protein
VAFGPNELLKVKLIEDVDDKHLSNFKLLDFALINVHVTEQLVD